jgi:hypothetical protein
VLPGCRPVNFRTAKRRGCVNTPMLSYVPLLCPAVMEPAGRSTTGTCERGLSLVHTFRFSTGRQVTLIAGQSSGTQESIRLFTQPGRLAGREFTGRLPGSTRINPLLCPVAVNSCARVAYRRVHTLRFLPCCIRAITPLQCQQSTETVVFQW